MSTINDAQLKQLIEASIFSADKPMSIDKLKTTVLAGIKVSNTKIKQILIDIEFDYSDRGVNLIKVASGYRFQAADHLGEMLGKMWQERPPKYSRALLETLALIAFKQPITRGEIENVRGVSVSSNIMRTLIERGWVKAVGHKEVPGRPSLYGTTNEFLDYFSLSSLSELPELIEPESLDLIAKKLESEFMGVSTQEETPKEQQL
ncbi:MAG: SMC-Scp complex subunit ScpB [Gammaproteobacteria bacterium]|nr:SMC-Scp complex subunit ScpB [Gammaproteobacteria bacterium]